jgi:enamine deaminase RidA (YjgF/YER057c/UK114 family)
VSERRLIGTGSPFETRYGYSRAVVDGDWCFVAGTTGYDYATMLLPDDPAAQMRNVLATIGRVLGEAGFELADVVRSRIIVTEAAFVEPALAIHGEVFGAIRPAATCIIAGLIAPEMKVEVEVTALRRAASVKRS